MQAAVWLHSTQDASHALHARRWVSVRANVRVSGAARRSAREALQIALRAGGFSAMIVLGMVHRHPSRSGPQITTHNLRSLLEGLGMPCAAYRATVCVT